MRNLKRALSLALAAMMLIGMMVVSAGAASKEFTDKDEIKHSEAVNTLVTLNVMSGKEDGSYFDPTGTLTRAEMAKIISFVMNGGVAPVLGTKVNPTYSDIKGHWAEAYIEYCTSMGIITGAGAGKFNPEGTLTGTQAAKMFLTAMGYNAEVFGFTGSSWETNTNRYANEAGLYKELGGLQPSAPISRDDASQMAYNAIQARMMERDWSQNQQTGQITEGYRLGTNTLFSTKFNGTAYEGVLVASGEAAIAGAASEDYFSVQLKKVNGVELTSPATTGYPVLDTVQSFKYADQDLTDLLGQYVKVLYNNKTKEVYGVYSVVDMNTVVTVTSDKVSDMTSNSIKLDGVKYSTDTGFSYTITDTVANTVKFVDNNGNGKLNLAITTPVAVYKVTYVGNTSFTFTKPTGATSTYNAANASNKFEDVEAYEGMAKDDIVLVYDNDYTDTMVVEKANVVSGTVSGYNQNNGKYQIDGAWYRNNSGTTIALGNTVDYVAIGGVLYYAKVTDGATDVTNTAMVITYSAGDNLSKGETKLLFSDGTKKTVTLSSDSAAASAGSLYTFEINNSGEYKLTAAASFGDYTKTSGNTVAVAGGSIATYNGTTISDDAVIFLFKGQVNVPAASNDGKVITGKELKTITSVTGSQAATNTTAGTAVATDIFSSGIAGFTKATNGLTKVEIAAVATTKYQASGKDSVAWPTATSYANYGYIVSAPYQTTVDGVKYMTYQVWDGTNTVTYKVKTDSATPVALFGEVIGYDVVDAETIKNVTKVGTTATAVTGLSGDEVSFSDTVGSITAGSIGKLDGNTTYLYVNSGAEKAEDVGVTGGSVQLATNPASGIYVKNVLVVANADKTIKLIVVDVNNEIALQAADKQDITITNTASLAAGKVTLTVNGVEYSITANSTDKVKSGDIVKITNNDTTKTLTFTVTGVDGTHTGDTLAPGATANLVATGAADLAITWTSLA